MYAKWLVIMVLVLSPMVATANQIAAKRGRLELRVESRQNIMDSYEVVERAEAQVGAVLNRFSERARIDRKAGLRFNVLDFEDGLLKELGLSNQDGAKTEIYLKGPYVRGKPGLSFMIRF